MNDQDYRQYLVYVQEHDELERKKTWMENFWTNVRKTDSCWIWKGFLKPPQGYGMYCNLYAHRIMYELFKGRIPEGFTIDHLCRNPSCVNPAHLEAVTNRENTLRGNTIARRNIEKTHCPKGHPLSGNNLSPYWLKRGYRNCYTCILERNRMQRLKLKAGEKIVSE